MQIKQSAARALHYALCLCFHSVNEESRTFTAVSTTTVRSVTAARNRHTDANGRKWKQPVGLRSTYGQTIYTVDDTCTTSTYSLELAVKVEIQYLPIVGRVTVFQRVRMEDLFKNTQVEPLHSGIFFRVAIDVEWFDQLTANPPCSELKQFHVPAANECYEHIIREDLVLPNLPPVHELAPQLQVLCAKYNNGAGRG